MSGQPKTSTPPCPGLWHPEEVSPVMSQDSGTTQEVLVSRNRLFKLLQKIGCPLRLYSMTTSFHKDMHSSLLQWCNFRSFACEQWSEARLCTSTDPLQDIFLHAPSIHFSQTVLRASTSISELMESHSTSLTCVPDQR